MSMRERERDDDVAPPFTEGVAHTANIKLNYENGYEHKIMIGEYLKKLDFDVRDY